jgi:hypothetical protein
VGKLNPYVRTEAETMAWSVGVKTEQSAQTGVYVSDIKNGNYIKLREVDFGTKAPTAFVASAASALQGGRIEVRLDSLGAKPICVVNVPATGSWLTWQTVRATVTANVTGTHDVYLAFRGNKGAKLFNFDWWKFEAAERVAQAGGMADTEKLYAKQEQ